MNIDELKFEAEVNTEACADLIACLRENKDNITEQILYLLEENLRTISVIISKIHA